MRKKLKEGKGDNCKDHERPKGMAELRLQNTELKRDLKYCQGEVEIQKSLANDFKTKYLCQQQQTSTIRAQLDKSLKD